MEDWYWSEDDGNWLRRPEAGRSGTGYTISSDRDRRARLEGLRSVKNSLGGIARPDGPKEPPVIMGFHRPR